MWGKRDEVEVPADPSIPPRSDAPAPAPRPVQAAPVSQPVQGSPNGSGKAAAQIGRSIVLDGQISGSEDLFIDGEVSGKIDLKGNHLTVGPNGKVQADVKAGWITIQGFIKGNVQADQRVEIYKTGSVEGDLTTSTIRIEDGAVFRGTIDIVQGDAK